MLLLTPWFFELKLFTFLNKNYLYKGIHFYLWFLVLKFDIVMFLVNYNDLYPNFPPQKRVTQFVFANNISIVIIMIEIEFLTVWQCENLCRIPSATENRLQTANLKQEWLLSSHFGNHSFGPPSSKKTTSREHTYLWGVRIFAPTFGRGVPEKKRGRHCFQLKELNWNWFL